MQKKTVTTEETKEVSGKIGEIDVASGTTLIIGKNNAGKTDNNYSIRQFDKS